MASTVERASAWVDYLNELLGKDQKWLSALFLRREPCNRLIATRDHLPVENDAPGGIQRLGFGIKLEDIPTPEWSCGYLGVLNGFIGPGLGNYPKITAVIDPETKLITRFALTADLLDESRQPPPPPPDPVILLSDDEPEQDDS